MKRYIFNIIIILLISFNTLAQSIVQLPGSDQIKSNPQLSLQKIDTIYNQTHICQPLNASMAIGLAINIADTILHDTLLTAQWKMRLGEEYLYMNKYDLAMREFIDAKKIFEKLNDTTQLAIVYHKMGQLYYKMNVLALAENYYQKSLKLYKHNLDIQGLTDIYIDIAKIYYYDDTKGKTDSAFILLKNLISNKDINKKLTAKIYKTLGQLYLNDEIIDTAQIYFDKALEIYTQTSDLLQIAECKVYLGNIAAEKHKFNKALKLYTDALKIYRQKNYSVKIAETNNLLGRLYFYQKQFQKANEHFDKALDYSSILSSYAQQMDAYWYLSEMFKQKGNLKKANIYLHKYIEALKQDFHSKAVQGFAEIIVLFQNEENRKEIELLEKEDALKTQMLKNKQQQIYGSVAIIIIMLLLAGVLFYYMQKQKKINKLLQEQNRKINLQKKEIETQSKILEKATRDLLKQKDKIQAQNEKIHSSITYASRIQRAMLPSPDKFKQHFADSFVFFKPKETVSGDFYWISEIKEAKPSLFKSEQPDSKVVVAVVDCTGHGVPGAFMSMLADAYLNQIVNILRISEPDKILYELHKMIRYTLQQEYSENNDGMDLALCVIDKKQKILKFAGAKNPLVYIQNEKMTRIQGDLMSIGGLQKEKERLFKSHTVDITAKTWIYLYTDGFQDQFGGKYGRKYMAKPFRDFLFKNHKLPFEEQKQKIAEELKRWKGKKYQQMDDITVVGFLINLP